MAIAGSPQGATPTYISAAPGTPVGYQQVTAAGTAEALTVPAGAVGAVLVVAGAAVNMRSDGTAPTASVGWPIANGGTIVLGGGWLIGAQFIAQSGTATINANYFG